ncbi:MAG: hypothetical protein ACO1N7_07165 [Sphingobacteriaceae bacterium]
MKLFPIVALLFLLGCSSGKQPNSSEDTTLIDTLEPDGTITDTTEITPSSQSSRETKTFKGLYKLGNEINTFRDCKTGKVYWVEDESKKLADAYKKTKVFLSYPYESVYAELEGYLKGKSTIGYAGEYENVLSVTNVDIVTQKSFRTECYNYEFVCLGNEPFWSLDINPQEQLIVLKDVGSEQTYVFPYKAGKSSGNTITYATTNDKKESLKAIITKETCSDGMSDRTYNYSAQISFNGKLLKGCAIKKGEKFPINQ